MPCRVKDHHLHIAAIFRHQHLATCSDEQVVHPREYILGAVSVTPIQHRQDATARCTGLIAPHRVIALGGEIDPPGVPANPLATPEGRALGHLQPRGHSFARTAQQGPGLGHRMPHHSHRASQGIALHLGHFQRPIVQFGISAGGEAIEPAIRLILGQIQSPLVGIHRHRLVLENPQSRAPPWQAPSPWITLPYRAATPFLA